MKLYKVWCEYDMGWNIDDNMGVYSDIDSLYEYLDTIDWEIAECSDFKEAISEGLLTITRIEG